MKISEKFLGQLARLQALPRREGAFDSSVADEEPPLRSELFNADQMAQHGKHLAATHRLLERHLADRLLPRLADNERLLTGVCKSLVAMAAEKRSITPAGEWLLDNFYLIEEQIRTAKRHLPKGYSRQLPRLLHGPSAGLPRVYDIALETIAHGDARVDPESLSRFIVAYQTVTTLSLGELWAIPIMLRLALIENLRRVAARIAAGRRDRDLAASWARRMTEVAEKDPRNLILVIADMARSRPTLTSSFVAELTRQLHGRGAALALPLSWIEQGLAESHQTIEQLVQSEAQQQAADQVSIGNSIGSLRFLGAMDWNGFVETMSVVEQTLRCDPAGVYSRMDFATRDRYRHVVERIARRSGTPEAEVAKHAVRLAHHAVAAEGGNGEMAHVGFYLIDRGLTQLERVVDFRLSLDDRIERRLARMPLLAYLGGALLLTLALGSVLVPIALAGGVGGWWLALLAVLLLVAISQPALFVMNWLVSLLVAPRALPRLDFSEGIPTESRTLVVVPSMLSSRQEIEFLLEKLEVRFLANRDDCLHFALLTDFCDAPQETLPDDEALLRQAAEGIAALNEQYVAQTPGEERGKDIFFLLHRPRRWNPAENAWMGQERKRGKLADLNALLRGHRCDIEGRELFSAVVGDSEILQAIRYVITLDTDTQLPRDAARQFVGTMAHPLNHARYDETRRVVRHGHGILQPRVDAGLVGSNASLYARIFGSTPGIDPYSRASSDVYQDLFAEGSFIGKGIYEVDAFEQALGGRFPDNRILSHDLIEGCYARSGLISDVPLYEDYPSTYELDVGRRHRWIRGDWQLLAWLFSKVPAAGGRREENPLSPLSQWKIFDNLRRSLVSTALTALLLIGWVVLSPMSAALWTLALLAIFILPGLLPSLADFLRKPQEVLIRQHLLTTTRALAMELAQAALNVACLPYDAYFSLDAIARTLWRLMRRRHLLEWKANGSNGSGAALTGAFRRMWIGPVLALAVFVGLMTVNPMALAAAFPLLVLWAFSPAVMWWISRPRAGRQARLSATQTRFLRKIARRTWAFFESFVGPDDRWLPPDNYQKYRNVQVAHRTSPTNIGLALLSNLTAHDFGYLPTAGLLERTANTLASLEKMERYQGHFYNWYDTQSLEPLYPRYVSSVDSGNFVGHLLVLRTAFLALPDEPVLHERWFEGLADTLNVPMEAAAGMPPTARAAPAVVSRLLADLEAAATAANAPRRNLTSTWYALDRLQARMVEAFGQPGEDAPDAFAETEDSEWWLQMLLRQCKALTDDLLFLAPWLGPHAVPTACRDLPVVGPDSDVIPSLRQLAMLEESLLPLILERQAKANDESTRQWLEGVRVAISETARRAAARMTTIDRLVLQLEEMSRVEYGFLYDKTRHLLAIGYNVSDRRLDASYYDLLASEARLCNFVAIAQGQLPQESWFALGRLLTLAGGEPTLLSWSGSMFEYLMPQLVMPSFENTLLDQTNIVAVKRQIAYGKQRGVPWGISESGYNVVDLQFNYQYRAFGVPGLGLKRGLGEDLVIAPYASALALMVLPQPACQNMQRLAAMGLEGRYGLFEAIDYTPVRQRRGENKVIIRSFMAHHQGMSLLAIASVLLDAPMQRRFAADPLFQATMLLLQERVPKASVLHSRGVEIVDVRTVDASPKAPVRVLTNPDTPMPEVQLLSNGRYHVAVSHAGGGSSRWKDLALTRWREDGTRDNHGTFCYLRDLTDGAAVPLWSAAYQPTLVKPTRYEAIFSEGRAEFRRIDGDFSTHTDIVVSPEDDIELRRVRITNNSRLRKTIDATSYAEVVLAPAISDDMHPAFSNLFVQTEIVDASQAIVCTRRPRSSGERPPWMFHVVAVHGAASKVSYETDRARFIGRGNTVANPQAMRNYAALSGSEGSVLDPIVAIRHVIALEPDETVTVDIVTGIAETREGALGLVAKYRDRRLADRVFDLAWTHSQVVLQLLNASEADAQLYARLASSVIYSNPVLRAPASVLARNRRGQSGLWGYAISGDLPIVLLQIANADNIALAKQLVQAHAYWHLKGLSVDLVVLNEERSGYRQSLQEQIVGLIGAGVETQGPGKVFVRPAEQTSAEDRILFQSVARVVLCDNQGSLEEQIARRPALEARIPRLAPSRPHRVRPATSLPPRELILENGLGGFTPNGREYVIATQPGQTTPAPWVNVLANPVFGSVVSESGQAYTWSENAHEFRLTPWHNDPVSDSGGEVFYLRDQESGHFWSPTPLPSPGAAGYVTRHGFGYSVFEHEETGIRSELTVYVAIEEPIKFSVLKLKNDSGQPRSLSVTGYVEWVLGDLRARTAMHVTTEIAANTGAILASNPYNTEFPERFAFFDVDAASRAQSASMTGDRLEFIGRNGSLANPAAMTRMRLSGKAGAGLDPCAAIQVGFTLAEGEEREIIFRLGIGHGGEDAGALVRRFRGPASARTALDKIYQHWGEVLGTVQVKTPDPALDVLANGWLVYQTMACRFWARSGYYQSGGAFGFRDQLQDAMALLHAQPRLLRQHLLLSASRQFVEGDVQHWWHPPAGRGVRTQCSDDYLWLPLATCRYVFATADTGILDEAAPFLEGRPVDPGEDSYYDLPAISAESATLYEHCVRAVRHGLRFGVHGLPLMGSGDWNDGMNRVGIEGKGESVWLGFFLYQVLDQFARLAHLHGDDPFSRQCAEEAERLRHNIEFNAWDGEWYRRAYFDDGTPLGSAENVECRIDSISQSWSVLSGAGNPKRSRQAMEAVYTHLVRPEHALVQLLDPPFDKSDIDPGYIRGYVPGVRENGGQYTHSAVWTAMAFAALGDARRAWELLSMINPVNHGNSAAGVAIYKVEPYVVAADVYGVEPHAGRGGWSWYTGSAGWLYRLIVESILGLRLEVDKLRFSPCLPPEWKGFSLVYRYRSTDYRIKVSVTGRAGDGLLVTVDGEARADGAVPLVDDGEEHVVEIELLKESA